MRRLVLFCMALLASAATHASVIYSTNVTNISRSTGGSGVYGSATPPGELHVGAQFTANETASLSSVDVSFFGIGSVVLGLHTDDGTGRIGSLIESFQLSIASRYHRLYSAESILNPVLTAGSLYWLVATPGDDAATTAWSNGISPDQTYGPMFLLRNGQGNYGNDVITAFRLTGEAVAAVPEPSSIALLGLGFIGLLAVQQPRRLRAQAPFRTLQTPPA